MTDVIKSLNYRANSQKRISKPADCSAIINFINMVNRLDEDEFILEGRHQLDSILIPNEFVPFVMPASVRVNPLDRRTNNLLDIERLPESDPVSVTQFRNACEEFRGAFKLDCNQDMTPLSSVRKAAALFDVIDRVSVDGKVKPSDSPYIPVPVIGCDVILGGRLLIDLDEDIVSDFINLIKFR